MINTEGKITKIVLLALINQKKMIYLKRNVYWNMFIVSVVLKTVLKKACLNFLFSINTLTFSVLFQVDIFLFKVKKMETPEQCMQSVRS